MLRRRVVWGAPAEACAGYLDTAGGVGDAGRLAPDRWTAEDGTARRAHRIVAANVAFFDRPATKAVAA